MRLRSRFPRLQTDTVERCGRGGFALKRQISIDKSRCGSTGNCVYWAPQTFDQTEDGVAFVKDVNGDSSELIHQAASNCPMRAIGVVEED